MEFDLGISQDYNESRDEVMDEEQDWVDSDYIVAVVT